MSMDMQKQSFNGIASFNSGILTSVFLYGVVTAQTWRYFYRQPSDSWRMKLFAASIWILELANTLLSATALSLVPPRVIEALKMSRCDVEFEIFGSQSSVSLVLLLAVMVHEFVPAGIQVYFARRIFKLSGGWKITGLCIALAFGCLGVEFVYAVWLATRSQYHVKEAAKFIAVISTMSAVVDIIIATTFCYELWKCRPECPFRTPTRKAIDMLILWAVQTGLATSVLSLTLTVLILRWKDGDVPTWAAFYFILPKSFSISFMSSLNSRTNFNVQESRIIIVQKNSDRSL